MMKRRHFIKSALAALTGTAINSQLSGLVFARENIELEHQRKHAAKFTMIFASPYSNAQAQFIPHMHLELKQNIEQMSQGKIFVEVYDKGILGVGTELMAAVTRGHISAALISVSNLTRALPPLDIINIPYWSAGDQEYLNLISSSAWQQHVLDPMRQQGELDILMHYIPGPRTIATTKAYHKPISAPQDLAEVVFRIPASKVLSQFYKMTSANVIDVPWAEVASLAKSGRIHALDPSIVGLYAGPNDLKHYIGTVTHINSVQDAWLAVVNQEWLTQLPRELKLVLREAAELTFKQHLSNI